MNFLFLTADTLYFRPKENGKALPALYDFWDMRKTGDRTAFFLFNRPDERAYLADPVSLTFEPVIIRNLPEEIRTFSPFNRIIFPEKNIILWFTNVWIVMTNLDNEYLNHLVSPFTSYAEILQRENYELYELKYHNQIVFTAHALRKSYNRKLSRTLKIPAHAVGFYTSIDTILNLKTGAEIPVQQWMDGGACYAAKEKYTTPGGRHFSVLENEQFIRFSDAWYEHLIQFSPDNNTYSCQPLPEAPLLFLPEWKRTRPGKETGKWDQHQAELVREHSDPQAERGYLWHFQWIPTPEPNSLINFWVLASRNAELTEALRKKMILDKPARNKALNTDDFLILQKMNLNPAPKIEWEIVYPGINPMGIHQVRDYRIEIYTLIRKNNEIRPALVTWRVTPW